MQELACRAMWNLALHHDNQGLIREKGGVEAVELTMKEHHWNAVLRYWAQDTLNRLTQGAGTKRKAGDALSNHESERR